MKENLGGAYTKFIKHMRTDALCTIVVQVPGLRLEDEQKLGRHKKLYKNSSPFSHPLFTLLPPWIPTLACKNSRLATSSSNRTFFAVYTRTWNNNFCSLSLVEENGFESQIVQKSSQLLGAVQLKKLPKFEKDLYWQPCCVPNYPLTTIMKNVQYKWSKYALVCICTTEIGYDDSRDITAGSECPPQQSAKQTAGSGICKA